MPLLRKSLCHYCYDALDRLIGHARQSAQQHQRFYCKSRLATEIQGAMQYSILQHGDLLLAQQRSEAGAIDTTLLATDQQRSVLHTLKANHQCQPIAYSPYGHHRHPENGLLSLLGFNGERPDPVTGHYLLGNGYRAFNPVLMRFNGPDSFSPFGRGGLNTYAYCLGDPINLSDPNGTIPDFLKRMLGRPVYKSGPERPPNTPAESNYTDVAEFTPASDTNTNNWHVKTHRTSKTNEGKKIKIKEIRGVGYDGAIVHENNKIFFITRNRPIKLNELIYAQMPGDELAFSYRKLGMPEVDISNDHRNLFKARHQLSGTINDRQINALAIQGRLNGVRPKNAKILIRDTRITNSGDPWWEDPTRYHIPFYF